MDTVREMTPDEKAIATKARQKAYYLKNKERLIAYQTAYNKTHAEQTKTTHKKHTDGLTIEKKEKRHNQLVAFRERKKVKMKCELCNCFFQHNSQWAHIRSAKHLKNIPK